MRPAKPEPIRISLSHCCQCHSGVCGHSGMLLCPQHAEARRVAQWAPLPPWWRRDDEPARAPEVSWDNRPD